MASQQSQPRPRRRPVLWSELPPEMLGLILSNLGKHDLLNARVVSHVWNEESLKVLRKSNFTQMLREGVIEEYMQFATSTEARPFNLAFHLNFKINLVPGDLTLKSLTTSVDSLCQIFGPQCIATLTLTSSKKFKTLTVSTEEKMKETGLMEFMALISPGLESLDFTGFSCGFDFLQNQIITFPNLKKLICKPHEWNSGREKPGLAYYSLIENSPNLEDLTVIHPCDLDTWPLKFSQLKSLSLPTMDKPQNILNKILTSSEAPTLRKLSFSEYNSGNEAEDKIAIHSILESVSSTLKSLKFGGRLNALGDVVPRNIIFPKLPHLEHLALYTNDYINPEDINLREETFPSLKSIEVPIDFIFTSTYIRSGGVRIAFPKLVKLILRVREISRAHFLNEAWKNLQEMFPNPSKLSLVNAGGNSSVNHVLDYIMKSNWSKNIQEIQMIGFNQDFLGRVLNPVKSSPYSFFVHTSVIIQSEPVKMTNIKAIKLLFDESSHYGNVSYSSSLTSIPNLLGFGKSFPQLRMIEISELLVRQKAKGALRKHIKKFKSKFRGVVLIVI